MWVDKNFREFRNGNILLFIFSENSEIFFSGIFTENPKKSEFFKIFFWNFREKNISEFSEKIPEIFIPDPESKD